MPAHSNRRIHHNLPRPRIQQLEHLGRQNGDMLDGGHVVAVKPTDGSPRASVGTRSTRRAVVPRGTTAQLYHNRRPDHPRQSGGRVINKGLSVNLDDWGIVAGVLSHRLPP
jgi:hypothetical protein